MPIDPEQDALADLVACMVPTPDDLLDAVQPLTRIYYLGQVAWEAYRQFTAYANDFVDGPDDVASDIVQTLQALAVVCGEIDSLQARIGLLPPEAANVP